MDDTGQEVTFDPTNGQVVVAPFRLWSGLDFPFFRVSCPSVSQCTTVDGSDQAVAFNPQNPNFSKTVTLDPGAKIDDISCASITRCAAVDDVGQVLVGNPNATAAWSFTQLRAGDVLTAVSCATTTACAVVDQTGHEFFGDPGSGASVAVRRSLT